jgi:hypothetical protein
VFGAGAERLRWRQGFVGRATDGAGPTRDQIMDRFEAEVLQALEDYRVPTINLGWETTRWSVRVHGGPDGRALSDQFRTAGDDVGS